MGLLYPLNLIHFENVAAGHALDPEPVVLEHQYRQLLLLAFPASAQDVAAFPNGLHLDSLAPMDRYSSSPRSHFGQT